MIMGVVDSIQDEKALEKENGSLYYKILPIVSIVVPNPITAGIVAYTPECENFENCDQAYLDYYRDYDEKCEKLC